MIYLNTENSNFLSDLKTACCARGLDFAEFHEEDFIPSKKLTNVFVAEKVLLNKSVGTKRFTHF